MIFFSSTKGKLEETMFISVQTVKDIGKLHALHA